MVIDEQMLREWQSSNVKLLLEDAKGRGYDGREQNS
jgi:hypothetical protein